MLARSIKPFLHQILLPIAVGTLLGLSNFSAAAEEAFLWAENHPIDSELPAFKGTTSDGQTVESTSLISENGMLLFFNRSTIW